MKQIFKLNNLSFRWNNHSPLIFENVSLSINASHFTMILGKNGSGKSTLVKLLGNLIKPTNGEIFYNNQNINTLHRTDFAKNISYLAQDQSGVPLKVKDVVALGNFVRHSFIGKQEFDEHNNTQEALKIFDIQDLANKEYNELSGGEKQKVMLARAYCQSNKVMLLDEPTSSLDIGNKIQIMSLLKKLQTDKGTTILAVTHDFNLAQKYADDIILIMHDKIVYGSKESILTPNNLSLFFDAKINVTTKDKSTIFYY